MRRTRVYYPHSLIQHEKITLDAIASHHLLHVLRKKIGDIIFLFDGEDAEYACTLVEINKKNIVAQVGKKFFPNTESPLLIHLGQAISRGDRMDYAIQKSVELGIFSITPLITEFCQVTLSDDRMEKRIAHWQAIAVSAAEQSGRCAVPQVHMPVHFNDWVHHATSSTMDIKLICCPRQDETTDFPSVAPKNIALTIGPEGGLSDLEIKQALSKHFVLFSLGPRILRTETAATVAITLLQQKWGDLV